ncbi:unnamed protein product [Paramecium primaurelia]|uniref:Transmembrane protein n=1 Tax=Paramecium primaurelia TaxID=5886 RepID=A0A8S1QEW1_PARPR|nr:unnamed protein product [Paramecium primaurelia]
MSKLHFSAAGSLSDPQLDWQTHKEMNYKSEFQELIETRLNEIKKCSRNFKYYGKIGFQVLIYLLSVLELIFTLIYSSYNNINDEIAYYEISYNLSIILCVSIHSGAWMYTYHIRNVAQNSIFVEITNYLYYMGMGILSYFKLAPFIIYYNRDQSIRQFSFSQINKYLLQSQEDKQRNPCRLFKDRKKPVNIFRNFIFHRVALLSMMITMAIQTIPQLFIQGFFNTLIGSWDVFNIIIFVLLTINLIYYLFELQFIVFTTNNRQTQKKIPFKQKQIKLKFIQETKQLLKSDSKQMEFFNSYYFHIDPSNFSPYQKKRCMIQIISYLLRYKEYKYLEFHFIDEYDEVTLQYLANCFKLIQVKDISLLYKVEDKLSQLESIFRGVEKLNFFHISGENLQDLRIEYNTDEEREIIEQIKFIQNPKIIANRQALPQNQFVNNGYIQLSAQFSKLILIEQNNQAIEPQNIAQEAKNCIDRITKRDRFKEHVCEIRFLVNLYDIYHYFLDFFKHCDIITILSSDSINIMFSIFTLIYLTKEYDLYKSVLVALTAFNVIFYPISFGLFYQRAFKTFSNLRLLSVVLIFTILNTVKMYEILWFCLDYIQSKINQNTSREFIFKTYVKFKNYVLKFQGNIASVLLQFSQQNNEEDRTDQRKEQPLYIALMWRANIEDTLNRIPQLFIYILSLSTQTSDQIWTLSFTQQIYLSFNAIYALLEIVIKDFFIPGLILSTSSVNQFLESIQYFNKISNQIVLEYPKSFSIMSKVNEYYLKESCTYRVNMKTLNFSNYSGKKKIRIRAQFSYVLACIKSILEIDQAQRIFCMGTELEDLIKCLKASELFQLKLNYYLDEINPNHIPHINVIIKNCPQKLKFLQLQVEATNEHQMKFDVKRTETLIAFSYSYFQIIEQYPNNSCKVEIEINLNINENFLQLDRYNFEEVYFEVSGNLILNNCEQLFAKFNYLKLFKTTIINKGTIQTFQFSSNLRSHQLEILDITFDNIQLDFQEYNFKNLRFFKMILINCEFNKEQLRQILQTLNQYTKEVYIDISQCFERFTRDEQRDLIRRLEQQGIDVVIKI